MFSRIHEPDDQVYSKLSLQDLQGIVSTVHKSYIVADQTIKDTLWLNTPYANFYHQDLYNCAVEFFIFRACQQGIINMVPSYRPNKVSNCHHVELSNANFILTFSAVQSCTQVPRRSWFRKELACAGQYNLFINSELEQNFQYGIITHKRYLSTGGFPIPKVQLGIPDVELGRWHDLFNLNDIGLHKENVEPSADEIEDFGISIKEIGQEHLG